MLTPGTIRTASGTAKGYKLEQFSDAFARYLPAAVNQTVTPSQTNESAAFQASSTVTPSDAGHIARHRRDCGHRLQLCGPTRHRQRHRRTDQRCD
jgi:hypothetical protein